MPALKGNKEKYVNGIKVDKENDDVIYNDEKHLYLSKKDNSKYIPVTTLIHEYTNPFNESFWASYKACEWILGPEGFKPLKRILLQSKLWKDEYLDTYNIDKKLFESKRDEVIQCYANKREEACLRGTAWHSKMEELFYQGDQKTISKYSGGGTFDVKKGYYKLDIDRVILPEFLISYEFDEYLKISGQIDFLQKDDNEIVIIDWKTSGKIDKDSYFDQSTKKRQMMKFPLENLPDCNFYHYSLQLSLYAYMLQQINPKFKIKKLMIVHFDHNGGETEYEVEYLKEDVARMLLHYRKQQKIKSELAKDKPIVF